MPQTDPRPRAAAGAPGPGAQPAPGPLAPSLLAVAAVAAVFAGAAWLHAHDPDAWYRAVQEDEALEWATFWMFAFAALLHARAARRAASGGLRATWFLAGLALFCGVVAMEEISWGQRVLGYRPPAYFLEHNYQQELNVHNVVDSDLRQRAFEALIAAYGIGLAALGALPALRARLLRAGLRPPPLALLPAFALSLWIYRVYPWRFAGEVVELAVGIAFLASGYAAAGGAGSGRERAPLPADTHVPDGRAARRAHRLPRAFGRGGASGLAAALLLGAALGFASAALSRSQRAAAPESIEAARAELAALERDFLDRAAQRDGRLPLDCGIHQRLYTFAQQRRAAFLQRGHFAAQVARGLPEERAAFFLDPWNHPYWVRSRCSDDRRVRSVFLYSFGPNRLRDSSRWQLRDDDVGVYLIKRGWSDVPPQP